MTKTITYILSNGHSFSNTQIQFMKFTKKLFYLPLAFASLVISCSKDAKNSTDTVVDTTPTVTASTVTVNLSGVQQTIDGFGGSTAWSGALSDGQADAIFGNTNNTQMGLSICRLRIDPNQNWSDERSNAQKANAHGAIVFGSPWTPPISMKTNDSTAHGELITAKYADFALYLKSFGDYIKSAGVTLAAISLENEPDWKPDYESCSWTGTQIEKFSKENAATIGYPFMIAESFYFNPAMTDPTLNDSAACANVSYIGGHLYGSVPFKYTNAINHGKKIWMTEHYYDNADNNSITIALKTAKEINDCMCNNMNAYVWWWMLPLNGSACNLIYSSNTLTKNGCALGQFAKWIRPGYKRVDATPNPYNNIYISAYTNGTKIVIVAVNTGLLSVKQPITIQNGSITSVTPYESSASKNIVTLPNIAVSNGNFNVNLDAESITTLVSN
jgi:glucuronoarabinoxylan endo-1,4-beta-xylanase